MALRALAAVEEVAAREALEGRREEEEAVAEEGSSEVRRSQRHEGQKPVNCSVGWRSQLKDERWGCNGCGGGGGCSVVGFITGGS